VPVMSKRRISPVSVVGMVALFVVAGFTAYGRIGTSANADNVEFTTNLNGGFMAIGMTREQPGFLVLSKLDKKSVSIQTVQSINRVTGTHTLVDIETAQMNSHVRLRGPTVFIVDDEGHIFSENLAWSAQNFLTARHAVDCSFEASLAKKSCGQPFSDLQKAMCSWEGVAVPSSLRTFLLRYADTSSH